MAWSKITISGVRNLTPSSLQLSPKLNFISGCNGSGKTSILESLCVLTTGSTFKSKNKLNIINEQHQHLTVYGEYEKKKENKYCCGYGLNRDAQSKLRINGQNQKNFYEISQINCTKVITPDVFNLISGRVKDRRNLIDWQLFHVEHEFKEIRKDYKRVLLQRNAFLKKEKNWISAQTQRKFWDEKIESYSYLLDEFRQKSISNLIKELNSYYGIDKDNGKILGKYTLSSKYSRGWPKDKSLKNLLEINFKQDFEKGYTHYGAHKFDFSFFVNNKGVSECLSRGELKTLSVATQLAQIAIAVKSNKSVLVLIDDLFAELDHQHAIWCIDHLIKLSNVQVLITGIDIHKKVIEKYSDKESKWFHVEHGKITEIF